MERVGQIMDAEEERDDPDGAAPPLNRDICFDHVSFAYEGTAEMLHDISLTIPAGSTLGILGGTGSGKSTLMYLLDRLYPLAPENGKITIGGVDIQQMRLSHLRSGIGIVLQEPFLFSRTLKENLMITSPDLTESDLAEASRTACLEETIDGFSKGYETFVGERGVTLSGGQKQRVSIARAILKDSPILILDDALSAVDTDTEETILRNLKELRAGKTTIIIAHRVSTVQNADRILVLDHGRTAEYGTREELMERRGIFYDMTIRQQLEQQLLTEE
jgi:ATP-binding cassette subfamily B protein